MQPVNHVCFEALVVQSSLYAFGCRKLARDVVVLELNYLLKSSEKTSVLPADHLSYLAKLFLIALAELHMADGAVGRLYVE